MPTAAPSRRLLLAAAGLLLPGLRTAPLWAAEAPACGPTARDALGPYYVAGTPESAQLNAKGLAGVPIRVEGRVFGGAEGRTPLAGATLEVWHADDAGRYHPPGSGEAARYPAEALALRGTVRTDGAGWYGFDSIRPGLYGGRARHLHYRVAAPGHSTLVTQVYFRDDPAVADDFMAARSEPCRRIELANTGALLLGVVDVVLTPA